MYFEKRYLQFNDLVFDGYDMLSDYSEPANIKGSGTAYSYGHGSYMPYRDDYLFVSERAVNMTITLKLKKLPCEHRAHYARYAQQELMKPGKLWAIKNNEIIWANASVRNFNQVITKRNDEVVFDVEFIVPGGVWNKADKQKTFLLPYSICALMDCKGFSEWDSCADAEGGECCEGYETNRNAIMLEESCGCCCDDEVTADMALCFHQKELQRFYSCETPYQLRYDCIMAGKFNKNPAFGQKICAPGSSLISGRFYSDTDLVTRDVTLTITGDLVNPRIRINGNENVILGEYSGTLIIESSGDVYYSKDKCCESQLLDPSVWSVSEGMDYGWAVMPGWNGIVVEANSCCMSCVYIDHTAITI